MNTNSKILITGCQGMAGWAIIRELQSQGFINIIGIDKTDLNLIDTIKVNDYFSKIKPEYVFHVAAKVGGINANNIQSADFIYENLMMECNIIEASRKYNVKKLIFCGSACIYPKNSQQPIVEESLLTGELEYTNEAYAVAKIAGVMMTRMYRKQYGCNFISAMPTNLYGIGDNFHLTDSHVMPALIRKFHDAKLNNLPFVEVWGTGLAKREFLYIDDLAKGLIFLMKNYDGAYHINVGTGKDISIISLIDIIKKTVDFKGDIKWNSNYPDGVLERRLNVTKINDLGWKAEVSVEEGIKKTYEWYINNYTTLRK
jgi:GDP-L-fucose synthase